MSQQDWETVEQLASSDDNRAALARCLLEIRELIGDQAREPGTEWVKLEARSQNESS